MSRRRHEATRELGYFAIGILPGDPVRCQNCATFVEARHDACPGCGDNVCRVCGCTDSHACEEGCTWVDRDKRLCSECVQ